MLRQLLNLWLGISIALVIGCSKSDAKKPLTIATAASLAGPFKAISDEYTKQTGTKVSLVIASSGKLSQQIIEGAPYDIFASANFLYTEQLVDANEAIENTQVVIAQGRLAMWVKSGTAPANLSELLDKRFEHVAIANPKHAPYGFAAKEALEAKHLWPKLAGKLVRGSNVRQAMQFAESGNAEVALIAHSLALRGGGSYTLVEQSLHNPLDQVLIVLSRTKKSDEAIKFIKFVQSDAGRAMLTPYGLIASPPPREP